MASSSHPMPLAQYEGDLTLPQMPEYRLKRRDRRDKSSLRQFIHQAKTLRNKKSKYLAETASIKDGDDALPHEIPNLNNSGAMNPALFFGIEVSTLISRDRAMLQEESVLAPEPVSSDSTISQRKRAVEHAKVIAEQLGKRSNKLLYKKRTIKSSDQETEIFRFKDLPPEIRDTIYEMYFTNSSGKKPGLLLAFKIDGVKVKGDFYNAAKQVYYRVNNWNFSIRDCLKNSILGNMDQVHVEMIRKMTIEIPYALLPET
jgi:hypothetical protein